MDWNSSLALTLNGLVGRSPVGDVVLLFFASYLAFIVPAVALLALYRARWPWRRSVGAAATALVAGVVARFGFAELIRAFYHHPRPFVALSEIRPLFIDSSYSFPSGHASFFFAFAMAVTLYHRRAGAWLFVAAALICLGRVVAGVHYPLDIVGGLVVGVVSAYLTHAVVTRVYAEESGSGE